MIKTVEWTNEGVRMLDQRLLPNEEKYLTLRSYEEVADAIKKMVVRGAPAIGVSAAMGLALGAGQSVGTSVAAVLAHLSVYGYEPYWLMRSGSHAKADTDQIHAKVARIGYVDVLFLKRS